MNRTFRDDGSPEPTEGELASELGDAYVVQPEFSAYETMTSADAEERADEVRSRSAQYPAFEAPRELRPTEAEAVSWSDWWSGLRGHK